MRRWSVRYLDEHGRQVTALTTDNFRNAQSRRDDLTHQGYEAWIEDEEPTP